MTYMADNAPSLPALVIPASGSWYGNDGSWSAFTISVGTPPQNFSVLPATNGQNTWIPIADDCKMLNITDCGSERGVLPFNNSPSPGFQSNFSTTWELIGLYRLGQNNFLGYIGNGVSGYDTVGFVSNNITQTLQIKHQAVTAYATSSFWLGQIGLGKRGMNFRQNERPESFLTNLKDAKIIPSLSYGFTAGASYRSTKVPASLTLGGYDEARAGAVLKVPLNEDDDRPLSVVLQGVVASNSFNGTVSLSHGDSAIVLPVDSSIPDLWLPQSLCDRFADVFSLQYNSQTNRYLLSSDTRSRLQELSPVFTFTIGTQVAEGTTITIQIPYASMDLQASIPIFAESYDEYDFYKRVTGIFG
ncbi:hypothetical protein N0V90_001552 [Kalmusia sp. IMI 367209]|nr:hypothetical protein N0V90_001552 [Kalmusia sp. IMI 367209]